MPLITQSSAKAEGDSISLPLLNIRIPRRYYVGLELAVLVAQLGLVDAAYSGDWSRIGIISPGASDTEG